MDDSIRSEYPAMLAILQPTQAAHTLGDRVRRIHKVNTEIADWIAERRRVEELYVQSLRKLTLFKVPNAQSELGSVESVAAAHQAFADRLERDVEQSLRQFPTRREAQSMTTMTTNITAMARELDEATEKAEKVQRRAGRANPQKIEAAAARLDTAGATWDSQAPFILESLQALDELRVNHLRDSLTQMLTHEADAATKTGEIAADVLAGLIDVQTAEEVRSFAARATSAKAKGDRRGVAAPRAGAGISTPTITGRGEGGVGDGGHGGGYGGGGGGGGPGTAPPPGTSEGRASSAAASMSAPGNSNATGGGPADDDASDVSMREESQNTSVFRRLGTVLGRRRQSVHGSFGQIGSGAGPATRQLSSSHGREGRVSPRSSSHNLSEPNRLSSLAETSDMPTTTVANPTSSYGPAANRTSFDHYPPRSSSAGTRPTPAAHNSENHLGHNNNKNNNNTTDLASFFNAAPASSAANGDAIAKDADGFTIVPTHANDPISQAQREAADDMVESMFKVSIHTSPVAEEDPDAKQAALSSVATTLSQMALPQPNRKAGTVRGRRDVRNTMYAPPSAQPAATATSAAMFGGDGAGGGGGSSNSGNDSNPFSITFSATPADATDASAAAPVTTSTTSTTSATPTTDTDTNVTLPSAPPDASAPSPQLPPPLPPMLPLPYSPTSPMFGSAKSPNVVALASEASVAGASDTQSVRSGHSLGNNLAHQHASATAPGLNASVVETVSATFADGQVQAVGILGEIAFAYGPGAKPSKNETIRINNFASLGSIGPNRICISNTSNPDQWTLDTSHLGRAPTAAFSYRVFAGPTSPELGHGEPQMPLRTAVPLMLKPVWKPDGDKVGLLLQYGPNSACSLAAPVTLHNVVLVASYIGGGRGARVQTKPGGTHIADKALIYWRLGDLTLDASTGQGEGKLVCRVLGPEGGAGPRPGHVEARWEYVPAAGGDGSGPAAATALVSGVSISRLDDAGDADADASLSGHDGGADPFADNDRDEGGHAGHKQWVDVPLARKLVSGKYEVRAGADWIMGPPRASPA